MFERWGRVIYRRRRLTLVIAAIGIVFAGVWGTQVFGALTSGDNFTPPNSQSQREADAAASAFGRNSADVVVLYRSTRLTVGDPAYRAAVTRALAGLPHREVLSASTYWSTRPPLSARLVSGDGRATYAVLQLSGADDAARQKTFASIRADLVPPGLAARGITAQLGGTVPTETAINGEVTADIGKAEGFSMPVLLILLLIIFGGLVAASLPLAIGGTAILGSFAMLHLLTLFTTVSIYSVNITTIIGLGLGIDYGLFMVVRFREELRRQPTTEAAVARTVATAGRTIAVSGVTVAVALTSLMLFPEVFLRSMGYGGVATVLVDMVAALTILPALLSVLGPRVNALRVRRSLRPPAAGAPATEAHSAAAAATETGPTRAAAAAATARATWTAAASHPVATHCGYPARTAGHPPAHIRTAESATASAHPIAARLVHPQSRAHTAVDGERIVALVGQVAHILLRRLDCRVLRIETIAGLSHI